MIRASAPGRCGILGNPTDGYGGTVISSSLVERAVVEVTAHSGPGSVLDVCGHREEIRDELELDGSYTDVAKAVLLRLPEAMSRGPFHLRAVTTVPMQAGLAGSTAMICAILGAMLRLAGHPIHPYRVAEQLRDIEFNVMRCVCGFQDQYMAALGRVRLMDFRGKDPHSDFSAVYAAVEDLEPYVEDLPLVLVNTGIQRHSGTVHQSPRERWIQRDPDLVRAYEEIATLARLGKVAMLDRDWARVGELMNQNHEIQRALGASGEANEVLIQQALSLGAWGAKLAGAGQGGTIVAAHPDPEWLMQRFQDAGADRVLRVRPSGGLEVDGSL